MNLSDFKEDTSKWLKGAPIKYAGAIFWVRRYSEPESNKFLAELRRKYYNPFENLTQEQRAEREQEILARWLAEFAVTKWVGVYDEENKELEHNKKNAFDLFCNPAYYHSINEHLILRSMEFGNYLYDNADSMIKNIKTHIEFDIFYPTIEDKQRYLRAVEKGLIHGDFKLAELNELEHELKGALYKADRERNETNYLKESQLREFTQYIGMDEDVSLRILKACDEFLLAKRIEKQKNDRESNKS